MAAFSSQGFFGVDEAAPSSRIQKNDRIFVEAPEGSRSRLERRDTIFAPDPGLKLKILQRNVSQKFLGCMLTAANSQLQHDDETIS